MEQQATNIDYYHADNKGLCPDNCYLCGYIYYSSLLIDRTRTAFIHVPMLNKPFSAAQMAAGIRIAMVEMLKLVPGSEPTPVVLVTGFGPFGNHNVNASWEAVQELEKLVTGDEFVLVTREIPVEYDTVKTLVPTLWKEYQPKLVVHIGVSGIAKELTIEQQAHNTGYDKADIRGVFPKNQCCQFGSDECIASWLGMETVCSAVNNSKCGVDAVISLDPGRYLCDYIYYTSLHINPFCTAFIHVPPLNQPYTARQLAVAIRIAILAMLRLVPD
ncbi:hypothetical protein NP493_482g00018 [Ridgeia piscesae]|uniref:Pyroglutamyl-peptidase I n=1 Tax=Ridgeia piscesae TaxID=27915 RepID=A0AAD9NT07_RIDPI|nr:hypothetical protein NP493_482g00018 [Ridgeia piscesae]